MRLVATVVTCGLLGCGGGAMCPQPGSIIVDAPGNAQVGHAVSASVSYQTPRDCVPDGGEIDFEANVLAPDGGMAPTSAAFQTVTTSSSESVSGTVSFTPDAPGTWRLHGEILVGAAQFGTDAGWDSFDRVVVVAP